MSSVVFHGDCLEILKQLADQGIQVDAVITDPPYHLTTGKKGGSGDASINPNSPAGRSMISTGFMGKVWDGGDIAFQPETWRKLLEVMKPGAHLLAFGGTRTYHRMACAIEDAGFEIRDTIMWLYGTGFPKSMDVAKAIDKAARGVPHGGVDPTSVNHGKYKGGCSDDNPHGQGFGAGPGQFMAETGELDDRELMAEAQVWQGFGTALKPSYEPIIMARKPLIGTVAQNVLKHGTGAINIDASRIGTSKQVPSSVSRTAGSSLSGSVDGSLRHETGNESGHNPNIGRWPANIIHDGSDEVIDEFARYGDRAAGRFPKNTGGIGTESGIYGKGSGRDQVERTLDSGTAARFFYCAKASKVERNGSQHPTIKPLALMRYLVKLVTPPHGIVLDPFAGTGTTGQAAQLEGFDSILIERETGFLADIKRRLGDDVEII